MTREIFLAVDATGLDSDNDRVVELVALESLDSKLTGVQFHVLLNPDYPIEHDAELGTGYGTNQLVGLPEFSDIAPAFVDFVKGADLIAFNPHWGFELIDAELTRLDMPPLSQHVHRLKDVRSRVLKMNLNVRLPLDKLSVLFDCREPVHACSQTWRECFLMAQVFPRLEEEEAGLMNIVELETAVPVHDGPYGTQYIDIMTIPEPWQSQFIRWLCAGELNGNERLHRCHRHIWADWLNEAPARCPELAPSQLEEFPFVWSEVRDAMRCGYQRAVMHQQGKFVRYRDDLGREMRYQAALANYGAQEKTLQRAYIRGFCRGLAKEIL